MSYPSSKKKVRSTPRSDAQTHGEIRIIGGRFRRRLIKFPALPSVRPTPDRVRETLFNWLGQTLDGWRVLDLFAGSGALSLEALSRGAIEAVAIESNTVAARALADNARTLEAPLTLIYQDARKAVASLPSHHFDVIFADPPFDALDEWLPFLLDSAQRLLQPEGWLYLEAPSLFAPPPDWELYRSATAGQVCYHLLRRTASSEISD